MAAIHSLAEHIVKVEQNFEEVIRSLVMRIVKVEQNFEEVIHSLVVRIVKVEQNLAIRMVKEGHILVMHN